MSDPYEEDRITHLTADSSALRSRIKELEKELIESNAARDANGQFFAQEKAWKEAFFKQREQWHGKSQELLVEVCEKSERIQELEKELDVATKMKVEECAPFLNKSKDIIHQHTVEHYKKDIANLQKELSEYKDTAALVDEQFKEMEAHINALQEDLRQQAQLKGGWKRVEDGYPKVGQEVFIITSGTMGIGYGFADEDGPGVRDRERFRWQGKISHWMEIPPLQETPQLPTPPVFKAGWRSVEDGLPDLNDGDLLLVSYGGHYFEKLSPHGLASRIKHFELHKLTQTAPSHWMRFESPPVVKEAI